MLTVERSTGVSAPLNARKASLTHSLKLEVDKRLDIAGFGLEKYPDDHSQAGSLQIPGYFAQQPFPALVNFIGQKVQQIADADEEGYNLITLDPLPEDRSIEGIDNPA